MVPKRTYRERAQPEARQGLGFLEKKKDYRVRAKDFHKKEKAIGKLRAKAAFKNQDEFYHRMSNAHLENSQHVSDQKKMFSKEELEIMKTQDQKIVGMKYAMASKQKDKLQANLHLLDFPSSTKHTIFVNNIEEVKSFNAADHFDTVPELVGQRSNRLSKDQVKKLDLSTNPSDERKKNGEIMRGYRKLAEKIESSRRLKSLMQEMEREKQSLKSGKRRKVRAGEGKPKVAKWFRERKR
mmetsp:Transcript_47321/g.54511  ORF Transcript_47321/g.54511 Transcript_47321/m.54511 type:complete len:239 (-) Transcript_47321:113-829(-)